MASDRTNISLSTEGENLASSYHAIIGPLRHQSTLIITPNNGPFDAIIHPVGAFHGNHETYYAIVTPLLEEQGTTRTYDVVITPMGNPRGGGSNTDTGSLRAMVRPIVYHNGLYQTYDAIIRPMAPLDPNQRVGSANQSSNTSWTHINAQILTRNTDPSIRSVFSRSRTVRAFREFPYRGPVDGCANPNNHLPTRHFRNQEEADVGDYEDGEEEYEEAEEGGGDGGEGGEDGGGDDGNGGGDGNGGDDGEDGGEEGDDGEDEGGDEGGDGQEGDEQEDDEGDAEQEGGAEGVEGGERMEEVQEQRNHYVPLIPDSICIPEYIPDYILHGVQARRDHFTAGNFLENGEFIDNYASMPKRPRLIGYPHWGWVFPNGDFIRPTGFQPGWMLPGASQPAHSQPAELQPWRSQQAGLQLGHSQLIGNLPGHSHPAGLQSGNSQPAELQRVNSQPAGLLQGHSQPAGLQSVHSPSGGLQPGHSQSEGFQPAYIEPGHLQSGAMLPAYSQPGGFQPRFQPTYLQPSLRPLEALLPPRGQLRDRQSPQAREMRLFQPIVTQPIQPIGTQPLRSPVEMRYPAHPESTVPLAEAHPGISQEGRVGSAQIPPIGTQPPHSEPGVLKPVPVFKLPIRFNRKFYHPASGLSKRNAIDSRNMGRSNIWQPPRRTNAWEESSRHDARGGSSVPNLYDYWDPGEGTSSGTSRRAFPDPGSALQKHFWRTRSGELVRRDVSERSDSDESAQQELEGNQQRERIQQEGAIQQGGTIRHGGRIQQGEIARSNSNVEEDIEIRDFEQQKSVQHKEHKDSEESTQQQDIDMSNPERISEDNPRGITGGDAEFPRDEASSANAEEQTPTRSVGIQTDDSMLPQSGRTTSRLPIEVLLDSQANRTQLTLALIAYVKNLRLPTSIQDESVTEALRRLFPHVHESRGSGAIGGNSSSGNSQEGNPVESQQQGRYLGAPLAQFGSSRGNRSLDENTEGDASLRVLIEDLVRRFPPDHSSRAGRTTEDPSTSGGAVQSGNSSRGRGVHPGNSTKTVGVVQPGNSARSGRGVQPGDSPRSSRSALRVKNSPRSGRKVQHQNSDRANRSVVQPGNPSRSVEVVQPGNLAGPSGAVIRTENSLRSRRANQPKNSSVATARPESSSRRGRRFCPEAGNSSSASGASARSENSSRTRRVVQTEDYPRQSRKVQPPRAERAVEPQNSSTTGGRTRPKKSPKITESSLQPGDSPRAVQLVDTSRTVPDSSRAVQLGDFSRTVQDSSRAVQLGNSRDIGKTVQSETSSSGVSARPQIQGVMESDEYQDCEDGEVDEKEAETIPNENLAATNGPTTGENVGAKSEEEESEDTEEDSSEELSSTDSSDETSSTSDSDSDGSATGGARSGRSGSSSASSDTSDDSSSDDSSSGNSEDEARGAPGRSHFNKNNLGRKGTRGKGRRFNGENKGGREELQRENSGGGLTGVTYVRVSPEGYDSPAMQSGGYCVMEGYYEDPLHKSDESLKTGRMSGSCERNAGEMVEVSREPSREDSGEAVAGCFEKGIEESVVEVSGSPRKDFGRMIGRVSDSAVNIGETVGVQENVGGTSKNGHSGPSNVEESQKTVGNQNGSGGSMTNGRKNENGKDNTEVDGHGAEAAGSTASGDSKKLSPFPDGRTLESRMMTETDQWLGRPRNWPNETMRMKKYLQWLLHATKCLDLEERRNVVRCDSITCFIFRRTLRHLVYCRYSSCKFLFCKMSVSVVQHCKTCLIADCGICGSFKEGEAKVAVNNLIARVFH